MIFLWIPFFFQPLINRVAVGILYLTVVFCIGGIVRDKSMNSLDPYFDGNLRNAILYFEWHWPRVLSSSDNDIKEKEEKART